MQFIGSYSYQSCKMVASLVMTTFPTTIVVPIAFELHRESKKTRHQTLAHNFTKYWPIFKILSLLASVGNF